MFYDDNLKKRNYSWLHNKKLEYNKKNQCRRI